MIRRLKNHPYAQCEVHINTESGEILFISYSTVVIQAVKRCHPLDDADVYVPNGHDISDGDYYVYCTGTYSQTTKRQISWFLREYFPTLIYDDMKYLAECENVTFIPAKLSKNI